MAHQNRTVNVEVVSVIFDGTSLEKPIGASFTLADERVQARAGGEKFNYLDESVATTIEGSVEFGVLTEDSAKALLGGSDLTSGWVWHREEAQTGAALLALDHAATATPLQSGSIIVESADGTKLYNEDKTGSPAAGEFAYLSASSINVGDTNSIVVSYATVSSSGNEYNLGNTDTTPYGELLLVAKGRQLDTDVVAYPVYRFPKARMNDLAGSLAQAELGSVTVSFSALADSNGKAFHFYTISG